MTSRNRRPHRLVKSLPDLSRSGGTIRSAADMLALIGGNRPAGLAEPLERDPYPYTFGPGMPITPAPLDPVRRDTGRAEPRIWDYPVSWNLPAVGQRLTPWKLLRDAADIPVLRDCIRVRQNEVSTLAWDITISQRAMETAQRDDPSAKRNDIETKLRAQLGPEIDKAIRFWQMPDRANGYTFAEWIWQALEECLVLDALPIYPRYTYGGELYSLEILDGSTVKPLLDHRGGRPLPPYPAYQQILHGFPRGEFTADVMISDGPEGQTITNGLPADQLIYIRRNVRTFTPYGLSAVEMSLYDADLWMKRMGWLKAEYTDGTVPTTMLKHAAGGGTDWQPSQLMEYERELNDHYSGNTAQRHRVRILPPGLEPVTQREIDGRYKPDYDLHLLKLVVAHFDMTIAELGFTEAKGLGSTGYHEGQENVDRRKGTQPTTNWLASILTDISRQHLGMPEELEFHWLGLDEEDQAAAEAVADQQFRGGAMTLNERRDDLGRPRYTFPEADMPMVVGQRGVVYLDGSSELAPAGETIMPRQAPDQGDAPAGEGESATDAPSDKPSTPKATPQDASKAAEAVAYQRFVRKGGRRVFRCNYLTSDDLDSYGVDPARVQPAEAAQ